MNRIAKTAATLIATTAAATALMGATPAQAATPQGVDWYGVGTFTYTGAQLNVAVAGTGSGRVGVVTSATPAVCSVGNPGQVPATWYPVQIKTRGTCVLVGQVAASPGFDGATSVRSIPVVW